jgi:hypothetical protein
VNTVIVQVGAQVGKWTVVEQLPSDPRRGRRWRVRCACGVERVKLACHLVAAGKRGDKTSCAACRWTPPVAARVVAGAQRRQVPESERFCRWCGRSTRTLQGSTVRECAACNRSACRYGREPDGRPIARGRRRVLAAGQERASASASPPRLCLCGAPEDKHADAVSPCLAGGFSPARRTGDLYAAVPS